MNRPEFHSHIQGIAQASDPLVRQHRVEALVDMLVNGARTDWGGGALLSMVDGSYGADVADATLSLVVAESACGNATQAPVPRFFAQRCLDSDRLDLLRAVAAAGVPALLVLPPVQLQGARTDAGRMLDLMSGAHTGWGCAFGMAPLEHQWSANTAREAVALLVELDPTHLAVMLLERSQYASFVTDARTRRQAACRQVRKQARRDTTMSDTPLSFLALSAGH